MTKVALITTSILLSLMAVAAPSQAVCTSLDMILAGPGSDCGGTDGGCVTYVEDPGTGTDSTTVTECSDGYHCEAHNHYNDPNQSSSTTYEPPGCGDDPRQGQ